MSASCFATSIISAASRSHLLQEIALVHERGFGSLDVGLQAHAHFHDGVDVISGVTPKLLILFLRRAGRTSMFVPLSLCVIRRNVIAQVVDQFQ